MQERLQNAEERYAELEAIFAQGEIDFNSENYRSLMKEYNRLSPLISCFRAYRQAIKAEEEAKAIYDTETDEELVLLAKEEMLLQKKKAKDLWDELLLLLVPPDKNDDKDIILEIRSSAGGEEAALFAADLYRMYSMYAASKGFQCELLTVNETELGGYKEIGMQISGTAVYSKFKFESGVHRVQRVPLTESQGRIQTSTATVAVLPVAEEVEVVINPADVVMETCKSSGAGGQHINKTESAVRLTHLPTGIVVECQEERSQFKNRDKAMKLLRARLYQIKEKEQADLLASERKSQVGTGDRSEKIRTYNFPQGRVTDHRIGLSIFTIDRFMNGEIDELVDALLRNDNAEKLKA
ncbi:MAG: peptide chain release factor 1 [Clostridia bacterium]|nr:peptide chain release factor 1 [Clostridia bacterium]